MHRKLALSTVIAVLASTVAFAAVPVRLSAERALLEPAVGTGHGPHSDASVIAGADGFLAIWDSGDPGGGVLLGARLAADGTPIANAFLIGAQCYAPAAAWNGSNYLVYAECGPGSARRTRVFSIDVDGHVSGERDLPQIQAVASIAVNGSAVAVGGSARGDYSPAIWVVGPDGVPQREIKVGLRPGAWLRILPASGGRWIMIHYEFNGMSRVVVSETTVVTQAFGLTGLRPSSNCSFASGRATHIMACRANEMAFGGGHYDQSMTYVLLDGEGRPLSPMEMLATSRLAPHALPPGGAPAVWADGDRYFAAWMWADGNGGAELRSQEIVYPKVHDSVVIDRSKEGGWPNAATVATSAAGNVLLWTKPRRGAGVRLSDLFARGFSSHASLQNGPVHLVSRFLAPERRVRLSVATDQTFAVWREGDAAGGTIAGALVGNGKRFTIGSAIWNPESPAVDRIGDTYLVVWREELWLAGSLGTHTQTSTNRALYRIFMRRYDRDGNALDAAPVVLEDDSFAPYADNTTRDSIDIANDGSHFLVVWSSGKAAIHAARITPSGERLDAAPIQLSATGTWNAWPSIEWTGREFGVVWREHLTQFQQAARLARFSIVKKDGTIASTRTLHERPSGPFERPTRFAAAWSPDELLLAWVYERGSDKQSCTDAQRFSLDGTALESARTLRCVATVPSVASDPTIDAGWDCNEWWVATTDVGGYGDAWAIPVSRPSFSERLAENHALDVTVARRPDGLVIGYTRFDGESRIDRIMTRSLTRPGRGRTVRH